MKRKVKAITIVLIALLWLAIGGLTLNCVFAQAGPPMHGGPDFTPLSITVTSPLANKVYSSTVQLSFIVSKPASWFTSGAVLYNYDCQGAVKYVRYSIDGNPSATVPANDTHTGLSATPIPSTMSFLFSLNGFSSGLHTISVSAEGEYNYWTGSPDYACTHNAVIGNSSQIIFFVNDNQYNWGGLSSPPKGAEPPKVAISSPSKAVFTANSVYLSAPIFQKARP